MLIYHWLGPFDVDVVEAVSVAEVSDADVEIVVEGADDQWAVAEDV